MGWPCRWRLYWLERLELIQDTVSPLLGQSPDPKLVKHIRDKIMSYPGVLGVHDLMVHDYGPGRKFASAHAEMAAEASPLESHDTLDNIEQSFRNEDGMIVTLHYDPIVTDDPKVASMRLRINAMAQQIDSRLSIHDLRCVPGPTHTNVIFDCVRPSDLQMSAEDLKHALAQRRIGIPQVDCQDYDRRRLRRTYPRVRLCRQSRLCRRGEHEEAVSTPPRSDGVQRQKAGPGSL